MGLNSIETIKECVLRGVGVAMIPMMGIKVESVQKNGRFYLCGRGMGDRSVDDLA
jgi:hypothetical protein